MQAGGHPYAPPEGASAGPRVIFWYRAYCAAMVLLYVLCVAGGGLLASLGQGPGTSRADAGANLMTGSILVVVGVLLAAFYGVATLVPRRPWGWTVGMVAIAIGLTGCTLVAAIPLAIHWVKPRTKAAFQRL